MSCYKILFHISLFLFRKRKRQFVILLGLICLDITLSFLQPLYVKDFVDGIAYKQLSPSEIFSIGGILVVLFVAYFFNSSFSQLHSVKVSYHVLNDIRQEFYRRILSAPYFAVKRYHSGDLMSRVFQETIAIQELVMNGFIKTFSDALISLAYFSLLVHFLHYWAFLILLVFPIFGMIHNRFQKELGERSQDLHRYTGEVYSFCDRVIKNSKFIAANRIASSVFHLIQGKLGRLTQDSIKLYSLGTIAELNYAFLQQVLYMGLFFGGLSLVYYDRITLGIVLAVISFSERFVNSSRSIMGFMTILKKSQGYLNRLSDVWNIQQRSNIGTEYSLSLERIEICGLHIGYDASRMLLSIETLLLEKGSRYALIGKNGSGKTSFLDILQGIAPLRGGSISFNNVALDAIPQQWFHDNCSVLLQENFLFDLPIKDNLLIVNENKEQAERLLEQIIQRFNLSSFFSQFPQQLNTVIYNNGENLSGGEKRLLEVIRLFLRQPQLVIIDEFDAGLDTKWHNVATKMLHELTQNIISITVSHRFNKMEDFDKILFIHEQKLFIDTHSNFLKHNEHYAEFVLAN